MHELKCPYCRVLGGVKILNQPRNLSVSQMTET